MTGSRSDSRFDAFRLSAQEGRIEGSLDARGLDNVADSLAPGDDPVPIAWSITGGQSAEGRASLALDVSGSVPLTCQRCLGRMDWRVAQATDVLLAKSERDLAALDAQSEVEVILAAGPLDPATLVEDELVLTLPFAPRHEGRCPVRE
jgi:uncharacterized protein